MAVRPGGSTAAFLNGRGSAPIVVVDLANGTLAQEFDPNGNSDSYYSSASYDGLVYSADGAHLYASLPRGQILIADVAADGRLSLAAKISLPKTDRKGPYPGGLALSADGKTLYVALSRSNALGVVDLVSRQLIATIPVGNAPHSVVVHGDLAFVTNEGGRPSVAGDTTNLSSGTPIVADPNTGAAVTGTVSVVDLVNRRTTRTISVGLHPTALTLGGKTLFVANTGSDSVSVIDTDSSDVVDTIQVKPFEHAPFGSQPNALSILPDGRLVVSLGDANALAVYDYPRAVSDHDEPARPAQNARRETPMPARLEGLLPTGWYPGALVFDAVHHQLVVANVKGVGSIGPNMSVGQDGPTGPCCPVDQYTRTGKFVATMRGSTSLIPLPTREALADGTRTVFRNNGWEHLQSELAGDADRNSRADAAARPLPLRSGDPSPIKHVFYIIKENNTYDAILGDDPRGDGDPGMNLFGKSVTPNHHALAEEFPLLDNAYVADVNSAVGHQWTDQALAPDYLEKALGGAVRSYPYKGGDSLAYLQSGFLWENAAAHGHSARVYGEYAQDFTGPGGAPVPDNGRATWTAFYEDAQTLEGKRSGPLHAELGTLTAHSDKPSLDRVLDHEYPNFNMSIPDQYRADLFLREFQGYVERRDLPELIMLQLPNDHNGGTDPAYPTPPAMVADNDLALGRIVDAISHSPYWKNSAIFVVEDDAQNDVDHVDGHRMVSLVISPYARRGAVDSTYISMVSVVRTIEQILGLPPMNQLDLAATPMYSVFTDEPDFTPYSVRPNTVALDTFNPSAPVAQAEDTASQPALAAAWLSAAATTSGPLDGKMDQANPELVKRAIWYSIKGYDSPLPGDDRVLWPHEVTTGDLSADDDDDD